MVRRAGSRHLVLYYHGFMFYDIWRYSSRTPEIYHVPGRDFTESFPESIFSGLVLTETTVGKTAVSSPVRGSLPRVLMMTRVSLVLSRDMRQETDRSRVGGRSECLTGPGSWISSCGSTHESRVVRTASPVASVWLVFADSSGGQSDMMLKTMKYWQSSRDRVKP